MVDVVLSEELKLVLALTARGVRRQVLGQEADLADVVISAETDWQKFVSEAYRHSVILHVLVGLDGCNVPDTVRKRLSDIARPLRMNAQLLKQEMLRLSNLLEQSSLPMVVLKGPALSQQLYGSVEFRFCNDLDLWVSAENLLSAQQLLLNAGYRLKDFDLPISPIQFSKLRQATAHHLNFYHQEKDIYVEMHWRLFNHVGLLPMTSQQQMLTRSKSLGNFHHKVDVLADEDQLLFLSTHGATHRWQQIRWLADIAAILLKDNLNWQVWCKQAVAVGLRRRLRKHLRLLSGILS